jgi:hypothetical protein
VTRLRREWVLVAIVAVGVVVRLAWAMHAAHSPAGLHDPGLYRLLSSQLVHGHGYAYVTGEPTAYYPPGYPLVLAPLTWLVERGPLPTDWWVGGVVLLNVVAQAIAMVATAAVARRVTGRVGAGAVAAAVLAAWPNLVMLAVVPLTESVFLAVLTVALALAVRAPWSTGWERRRIVGVGVLLGVATLLRPVTLPALPLLVVPFLVARIGWRRSLLTTASIAAVAVAVLLPWVGRNAIVMHSVTLSTNTGDNLAMARYVGADGAFGFVDNPCFAEDLSDLERPAYETTGDAERRSCALRFVREHPGEEARLVFRRLGAAFNSDDEGLRAVESYGDDLFLDRRVREDLRTVANAYAAVMLVLAVPGALLLLRRGPSGVLVVVTAIALLLPIVVFFGDPRFKVPIVPGVAVAVAALVYGVRTSRST